MSENTAKTPLSVMAGSGEIFMAQGKKYRILPMKVKDVTLFIADNIIFDDQQVFNLYTENSRKKLDGWLCKIVVTELGEPVGLKTIEDDDWDLTDLRDCIRAILKISG